MSTLDLRCLMAQPNSSIGNVTTNTGLVEVAMVPQTRAHAHFQRGPFWDELSPVRTS